jgi:protein O-GlcNAc transferase
MQKYPPSATTSGGTDVNQFLGRAVSAFRAGNVLEAQRLCAAVIEKDKKNIVALHLSGVMQALQKNPENALQLFDRALKVNPRNADILADKGKVLTELGRHHDALPCYKQAISVNPGHGNALHNLGATFLWLKRFDEALAVCDSLLKLIPNHPLAFNNRGEALKGLGRYEDAVASYRKVILLDPQHPEAWRSLGDCLLQLKQYDEAFVAYDKALRLKSTAFEVESLRFLTKKRLCDWSNYDADCSHLIASERNGNNPYATLFVPSSAAQQLEIAKFWISNKFPASAEPVWKGERYNHDRIRVAYLSADFREHPVAFLMAGLPEHHDKSRFEVTAISIGPDDRSEIRRRLMTSFERFIDAKAYHDDQTANLIRSLEVDILVDLMGFTADSRTGIFACRPAPIQVNYLGYPGTMGAPYIDYVIADRTVIPESQEACYTEKVVILPRCYQANDNKRLISERAFTRTELGLPATGFVFCCFNNNYKITPDIFDRWMRILQRVAGSVLWLLEDNATVAVNLRKEAVARAVDPERLIFAKRMPPADHLSRQRCADLFLDTLPYNAHTTASDALWAGLPVVTCRGETFAGRVAASLLQTIGLSELITTTLEDYERLTIELAEHPEQLSTVKEKLANNRLTTALFDTRAMTQHIEAAYATMNKRHRAGLLPEGMVVPN